MCCASTLLTLVALQMVFITTHCHHAFALGSVCGWKGGVKFGYNFFFFRDRIFQEASHMIMIFFFFCSEGEKSNFGVGNSEHFKTYIVDSKLA